MPQSFTKDPNAVLDYSVDWETWLNGDTIVTSTWVDVAGITKVSDTNDATSATIKVSGGTVGTNGAATNRIVTAAGRQDDRTLRWRPKER